MPQHYNVRGNKTLLKKHMIPIQDKPPEAKPEPVAPPPSAEKPPVMDGSLDDGTGSSSGSEGAVVENDTLILIGLGALLLFSYGMVR